MGEDGGKLNLRKADLQRLRDSFAEKLRHRGIEAESTPRHARGATRRGEVTPVYKIRQRGGKPLADARKLREVHRDLEDNGGRLPQKPWDDALVARRSRVMAVYDAAARILARSSDPADRDLAAATRRFVTRLTETTTQRAQMAQSLDRTGRAASLRSADREHSSSQPDRDRGNSAASRGRGREGPER